MARYDRKEYELIYELRDQVSMLSAKMDQITQHQPSSVIGFLDFIARLATCPPRADGILQFSEILTGMGLVAGSWLIGKFGAWQANDPELLCVAVRWGCYSCIGFWTFCIVSPVGIWNETFGRWGDAFAERLAELAHNAPSKPQVRLLPIYSSTGKPKQIAVEQPPEPDAYDLTDELSIPVRDLLGFVTTAARTGDWTRSGWCGGDGKPGRGMSQPVYYAIRDELQREGIKVWGKGLDSPALRAFLHSFGETQRTKRL
jgi:hypothetical protein